MEDDPRREDAYLAARVDAVVLGSAGPGLSAAAAEQVALCLPRHPPSSLFPGLAVLPRRGALLCNQTFLKKAVLLPPGPLFLRLFA